MFCVHRQWSFGIAAPARTAAVDCSAYSIGGDRRVTLVYRTKEQVASIQINIGYYRQSVVAFNAIYSRFFVSCFMAESRVQQ